MSLDYIHLRKRIFVEELKTLQHQLRQFSLLIFLFMYTAIPAFGFMLLLGFGVILDNQQPITEILTIVVAFGLVQAVINGMTQRAVFGSKYKKYLNSLHAGKPSNIASVFLLSIPCQVICLINAFILFSVPIDRWDEASHGWLLLAYHVSISVLAYSDLRRVSVALIGSVSWLVYVQFFLETALSLEQHLFILLGITLIASFVWLPSLLGKASFGRFIHPFLSFWLSHYNHQRKTLFLQFSTIGLCLLAANYWLLNLPQFHEQILFVTVQLCILICATVQINANKTVSGYPLFLRQFNQSKHFRLSVFYVPIGISWAVLACISILFNSTEWLLLDALMFTMCLVIVRFASKHLAAVWFVLCAISGLIRF